jgi:uncharacterized membrane protein HdeD (DUF308 family)
MTLLSKKTGGLALTLLGGLTLAHGAAAYRTWEALVGLLLLAIGVALLTAKIVRRNTSTEGQTHK